MKISDIVTKLSGNKMANKQNVRKSSPRYNRHPQQVAALQNLLSQFVDNLSVGYSEEAWIQAGRSIRRLSGYLFPAERELLAAAWRDYYTDNDPEAVRAAAEQVRARL